MSACAAGVAALVATPLACGTSGGGGSGSTPLEGGASDANVEANPSPGDAAGEDAGSDAGLLATGTRLVVGPATLQGVTSDFYVVFSQPTGDAGAQVAEVIGPDGGGETAIATGTTVGTALKLGFSGPVAFVWTDRGDKVATLTVWSNATGVVPKGPGIRPGRAAATADGTYIGYVDNVQTSTADLVVSPITGSAVTVGTLNISDNSCWQGVDLGFSESASAPEYVTYYCPAGSTAYTLQGSTTDGATTQVYSTSAAQETIDSQVVAFIDSAGNLATVAPPLADAGAPVALSTGAASFEISSDQATIVLQTTDERVATTPASTAALQVAVPAGQGAALGPLSPDKSLVMFASALGDAGPTAVGIPMNVELALVDGGGSRALVTTPTSCAGCINDNFTPDTTYAMVLDPIDDSETAGGVGPLHVFPLDGGADYRLGGPVWTVVALGTGSGAQSRFLFVESTPSPTLLTGYAYTLYTRSLDPTAASTMIAEGVEWLGANEALTQVVYSIPGAGPLAGVWIAPLQ
jgi:hypothetical protein